VEQSKEPEAVVVVVRAARADLSSVDLLARLQLAARRMGWTISLCDATDDVRELLEFVGLSDVLALEARRQPEERVELGVQEVVQPGDPPA
jgi:ABC-type transporter Mla MlaB component